MDLVEAASANEHRHPWELSRLDSLLRLLAGRKPWHDVADVGAGDCFVAAALRRAASGRVYAIDVHFEETGMSGGIERRRDVEDLPDEGLDCVVMMDVLEHVEDEGPLVADVRRKLRQGGTLLVTVPAFPSLFSAHDTYLKHFRRYRMEHLHDVLGRNGFAVDESFYFYSSLFVARSLQLALARVSGEGKQDGVGSWQFGVRHPATRAIRTLLDWDFRLCRMLTRWGLRVPGLSACAVCTIASA
ncbi:MAG: methyltransferase domain-containing protein [Acidobacteria bacterium]|nr:methyltransferase domain-containing protein [Acidobacteriota bacterium]